MPIYTYQCTNCGVRFERHQHFNDQPLTRCPECDEEALRKVYQPVGIVFKGSGFYATDHRSPSGASRASTKTGESESKNGSESSSDSKPVEGKSSETKAAETTTASKKD